MTDTLRAGTIMMRAGTIMPESLRVEAEAYCPAWDTMKESDGGLLDRNLRGVGWSFFFLAARIEAMGWGSWKERTVRRAIKRVLEKVKFSNFNCLEITRITAKRFLGLPYVHVSAHSRHIQKGHTLQAHAERGRAEVAADWALG